MVFGLILLLLIILTRVIQVYLFIKQVSKICHIYDWRYVDENPIFLIDIIKSDYFVTAEWSAYNFLFLKGPSPVSIFFSLKKLTIESIYGKESLLKLKEYEIN
jgi:hypothetical protein